MKRILVVRRDNIGDLVCTTPLFDALRSRWPDAWIGALANTYNAEVLARNPSLDAVYAYEKTKHRKGSLLANVMRRLRIMSQLRARKLDYVLVPAPSPRTLRLAASLKPREIVAAEPARDDPRHEVERIFSVGLSLGVAGPPGRLRVFPDPGKKRLLEQNLGDGPFVAVHISARQAIRRWPIERYAALIRSIAQKERVLLLWSPGPKDDPRHPGDDAAAAQLLALTAGARIVPLPTPDLATAVAALSLARCVICPEGGTMHLAAALGKPLIALWGDQPVERWRPWGVPHRVLLPSSGSVAEIGVDEVARAFADL